MNMDKKMELIENHSVIVNKNSIQNAECVNRCFVVLVKHTLCF